MQKSYPKLTGNSNGQQYRKNEANKNKKQQKTLKMGEKQSSLIIDIFIHYQKKQGKPLN